MLFAETPAGHPQWAKKAAYIEASGLQKMSRRVRDTLFGQGRMKTGRQQVTDVQQDTGEKD